MQHYFGYFSLLFLFLITSCGHLSSPHKNSLVETNHDSQVMNDPEQDYEGRVQNALKTSEGRKFLATELYLKGNMAFLDNDFETSAELFKYVYELEPNDEFVQKKYAVSLIRVGDLESAQKVLEILYKKTSDERIGLILAGVYTGLDQETLAQQIYKKILVVNPQSEDACVFLSKSYAVSNQLSKASSLLDECAKRNKKNGIFDLYAGKLQLELGKKQIAINSFKKALSKQKNLSQAAVTLGSLYEEGGKVSLAIELYKNFLKTSPHDSSVLARLVNVLFLSERYKEVISYAEQLSDFEPENLNLRVKLGVLYTDAKMYPEALSIFKDLLNLAPDSDKIIYYIGAIYQELGKFNESIEYFKKIPAESGLYADSSIQVANMYSHLAQKLREVGTVQSPVEQNFLVHVDKGIKEQKDLVVEFSVIKAGFYEAVGENSLALEALLKAKDDTSFSTQHKYYLANLYEKDKKFDEATNLILGIVEKEPKNAEAWNFLGYTYLVRGQELSKAYEYIQKALTLNPNDGYIRDSLGWYYFKVGRAKDALKELKIALSKVPDDVEILKHLAVVYRELKDYSRAKVYFQEALKRARFNFDKNEIQASIDRMEADRLPASLGFGQ